MTSMSIDELFIEAAESADKNILDELIKKIKKIDSLKDKELSQNIEFLLETWQEKENNTVESAEFCIQLAKLNPQDTQLFRNKLNDSLKMLLPPFLAKTGILRALGLRDWDIPIKEIITRFNTLKQLKPGVVCYHPETASWGKIKSIDNFASSVSVSGVNNNVNNSIPLERVLSIFKIFDKAAKAKTLYNPNKKSLPDISKYLETVQELALNNISKEEIKIIAFRTFVPESTTQDAFEKWWNNQDSPKTQKPQDRRPSQARSLHELEILLEKAGKQKTMEFSEKDFANFADFFGKLKKGIPEKQYITLFKCIAELAENISVENYEKIFSPLKGKFTFWTDNFSNVAEEKLLPWAGISSKKLSGIFSVYIEIFGKSSLKQLLEKLPYKCVNALFNMNESEDIISDIIYENKNISAELILWIWKNRKRKSREFLPFITINKVMNAVSRDNLPKEWLASIRELKKILLGNQQFQKLIVENAGEFVDEIVDCIMSSRSLHLTDRQTVLVKLARKSEELKKRVERINWIKSEQNSSELHHLEILQTSVHSYEAKQKELEKIINIEIPANKKALAHARSYGDFRENAEYDAAKEKRNFLHKRRSELEHDLSRVKPSTFEEAQADETVCVGSLAEMKKNNGEILKICIAGIWDGIPEKNIISYKTELGQKLLHKSIGETVVLPEGEKVLITGIKPLPTELMKKFAG